MTSIIYIVLFLPSIGILVYAIGMIYIRLQQRANKPKFSDQEDINNYKHQLQAITAFFFLISLIIFGILLLKNIVTTNILLALILGCIGLMIDISIYLYDSIKRRKSDSKLPSKGYNSKYLSIARMLSMAFIFAALCVVVTTKGVPHQTILLVSSSVTAFTGLIILYFIVPNIEKRVDSINQTHKNLDKVNKELKFMKLISYGLLTIAMVLLFTIWTLSMNH